jgi:hypothetical protein
MVRYTVEIRKAPEVDDKVTRKLWRAVNNDVGKRWPREEENGSAAPMLLPSNLILGAALQ